MTCPHVWQALSNAQDLGSHWTHWPNKYEDQCVSISTWSNPPSENLWTGSIFIQIIFSIKFLYFLPNDIIKPCFAKEGSKSFPIGRNLGRHYTVPRYRISLGEIEFHFRNVHAPRPQTIDDRSVSVTRSLCNVTTKRIQSVSYKIHSLSTS